MLPSKQPRRAAVENLTLKAMQLWLIPFEIRSVGRRAGVKGKWAAKLKNLMILRISGMFISRHGRQVLKSDLHINRVD